MTDLDPDALAEAEHRGQYLLVRELLTLVEEHDADVQRGVSRSRLAAYAAALNDRGVQSIDAREMDALVDENLTEADSWAGSEAVYVVDGNVSAFPARWHDELTGEDDLLAFVELIAGDIASEPAGTATGASGVGVPQKLLVSAASALGPFTRDQAKGELTDLRKAGAVEERADQHPEARVWPTHE